MTDWQPIETAPKDAPLLLWDKDVAHWELGHWSENHQCWLNQDFSFEDTPKEYDVVGRTIYLPTHWQALPAPPVT